MFILVLILNDNLKDIAVLGIGKILQVLVGLVTVRLVTELLSENQVGIYYILISVIGLLAFGFFNPLGQFYGRHLIHWKETNNLKTATSIMLMLRGLAIPVALLMALALFYIFNYHQYFSVLEYLVFIVVSLIALIHGVLLNATNVLVSRVTFTTYSVGTLSAGLALSILFTNFYETAIAWLYGMALSQIIFSYALYRLVVSNQKFSFSKLKKSLQLDYIKSVFSFILPVTLTLFLQWGQTTSFRLIVENLYSTKILAFIAVGMALSGAIFSALESLATQFYMPLYLKKITNATHQVRTQAWNELAGVMMPIYIGVAIYVIAFAPFLAKLLVAEKFQDAFVYTMIGAIIELFRVTTNLVYLVSQSEVKTKSTILPYMVGFLIMIVSLYSIDVSESLWLVPVILAFSYLIACYIMFYNMKKLLPIRLDLSTALRSFLLMMPLLALHLTDLQPSILTALFVLALGGGYLLLIQYLLLKTKIKKLGSI